MEWPDRNSDRCSIKGAKVIALIQTSSPLMRSSSRMPAGPMLGMKHRLMRSNNLRMPIRLHDRSFSPDYTTFQSNEARGPCRHIPISPAKYQTSLSASDIIFRTGLIADLRPKYLTVRKWVHCSIRWSTYSAICSWTCPDIRSSNDGQQSGGYTYTGQRIDPRDRQTLGTLLPTWPFMLRWRYDL